MKRQKNLSLKENVGSAHGLGSYRPNCKGPFGRFRVKSWTVVKNN